jgi:hypothetical protein
MEIKVGLGSGNKDQMLSHMMPMKQTMEQVMLHLGPNNPIVGFSQYHNLLADMTKNAGLGDPSRYWKDPDAPPDPNKPPPPPPPPPPPNPEMIKAQVLQQQAQQKMQIDQMAAQHKMELEQAKAEHDMQLQYARMQADEHIAQAKAQAQVEADARRELYDVNKSAAAMQASDGDQIKDGPMDMVHPMDHELFGSMMTGQVPDASMALPPVPQLPDAAGGAPPAAGGMSGAPGMGAPGSPMPTGAPPGAEPADDGEDAVQTKILVQMAQSQQETAQAVTQAVQMMAEAMSKMGKPRGMRIMRDKAGKVTHSEPIDD